MPFHKYKNKSLWYFQLNSNIFLMKNYWHSFSRAAKSAGPTFTYQVSAHNLKEKRML